MSSLAVRFGITIGVAAVAAAGIGLLAPSPGTLLLGIVGLGLALIVAITHYVLQLGGPVDPYPASEQDAPPDTSWLAPSLPPRKSASILPFTRKKRTGDVDERGI